MKGYIPLSEEESRRVRAEKNAVGQWILVLADRWDHAWNGSRSSPAPQRELYGRVLRGHFSNHASAMQVAIDLGFLVVDTGAAAY